jgi:trigger factor
MKELPELDDEFASTVGQHANVAELRTWCEEQLREEAQATSRRENMVKVVEEAISRSPFDLPAKLIDHEAERLGDRLADRLSMLRINLEQYNRMVGRSDEEAHEELRRQAEEELRRSLVLQAIAEQEGVEVSEEAVDATIQEALSNGNQTRTATSPLLKDPQVRERVRASLREDRAADWLFQHVTGEAPEETKQEEEES